MALKPVARSGPARSKSPLLAATFIALAIALVCVSTWAKTSRYDRHASPSRHFSTSVKVVQAHSPSWDVARLPADLTSIPWQHELPSKVLAPLPEPASDQAAPAVPLFPPLRAPPSAS
jgi:hypothetical protein